MLHLDAPVTLLNGVGGGPGIGIEPLSLAAQLRQPGHCHIIAYQRVPGGPAYNSVHRQVEDLLKLPYGGFCLGAENPIHLGNLGDGRITLGDAVEHHLQRHHAGP